MKDVIQLIDACLSQSEPFALATVLKTWGSAPRKIGAHMVVTKSGKIAGSVSGGCVEGDMARKAEKVIENQKPELIHYGVSNADAWQVGLSCGGKIDVYIEPFLTNSTMQNDEAFLLELIELVKNKKPGVVLRKPNYDGIYRSIFTENKKSSDLQIAEFYNQVIQEKRHLDTELDGERYFFEAIIPDSRLILIGASHIAADLVHFANQLGMETIVIDPRKFFTSNTSFESAPDKLIQDWPAEVLNEMELNPFTYVVTLTHDPKIDDQALEILLNKNVAYIGALGSRRTHAKRIERLKEKGFTDEELSKIKGPVGLSINAQTAKEIALSIIGEIVQTKNQYL